MYKLASIALFLSALAHIATTVAGNFSQSVMVYGLIGLLFLVLTVALFREKRWAAWLGFLLLLFGVSLAIAGFNSFTAPNLFFYIMTLLNITAFITLFIALWRHAQPAER